MKTQTIYRNTHTSAFTALDNALLCSALDATAQKILTYLLSKPTSWRLRATDLKNTLGLTYYKIKKGLRILKALGYVTLQRLTTGHTVWRVFETPIQTETPAVIPSVDFRHVEIEPILTNTNLIENTNKQLPDRPQTLPSNKQSVVVSIMDEKPDIPLPDTLKGSQAKAASKLLRNVTETQAALILMVFNSAMQNKRVNNPIGYLHQLVKAAQEGTLTAPAMQQQQTLDERISKQREALKTAQNRKIDNVSFFEMMRKQYGDRVQVPV
jgi:DNA-binding MarR family transcriptional regulator